MGFQRWNIEILFYFQFTTDITFYSLSQNRSIALLVNRYENFLITRCIYTRTKCSPFAIFTQNIELENSEFGQKCIRGKFQGFWIALFMSFSLSSEVKLTQQTPVHDLETSDFVHGRSSMRNTKKKHFNTSKFLCLLPTIAIIFF